MSGWSGMVRHRPLNEFEVLLQSHNERNKRKKKATEEKVELPDYLNGLINDETPVPIDYAFECCCYGTKHNRINTCNKCGRIICALEGERPCPFCGTIVLSRQTLLLPDSQIEKIKAKMENDVKERGWMPAIERTKSESKVPPKVPNLETDWFDRELAEIFDEDLGVVIV